MKIQVEIRKLHALIQNFLFLRNSFINATQSEWGIAYHFNQAEWSIVHQNKAKFTKFPWKRVLGTAVSLNIFSNNLLINFGTNFYGHVKEHSWNNEDCLFIIFEVIIENLPWKNIKDHISARKGYITYENFEILLRNLKHS